MIFNLFKSKPKLNELIPQGFVDIHSHIFPGIDDGAKNLEVSLELILKMKELGFSKIIGTPHICRGVYDNDNKKIIESYKTLIQKIDKSIKIGYAAEYMIDKHLLDEIEKKSLLTLSKNYVLIEMSYISKPSFLFDAIFKLRVNDYIPILAHPERYTFLHDDFKIFYKLKKFGCLLQLNLLSAVGYYGKSVVNCSDKLLKKNLIDYVGTDTHKINQLDYFSKNTIQGNCKISFDSIRNLEHALERNKQFD